MSLRPFSDRLHALDVIDGVVIHRYSTLNGRVTYQQEEL